MQIARSLPAAIIRRANLSACRKNHFNGRNGEPAHALYDCMGATTSMAGYFCFGEDFGGLSGNHVCIHFFVLLFFVFERVNVPPICLANPGQLD